MRSEARCQRAARSSHWAAVVAVCPSAAAIFAMRTASAKASAVCPEPGGGVGAASLSAGAGVVELLAGVLLAGVLSADVLSAGSEVGVSVADAAPLLAAGVPAVWA